MKAFEKSEQFGLKTGMKQGPSINNQGTLSKTLKRPMQAPPKPTPTSKKLISTMKGKN